MGVLVSHDRALLDEVTQATLRLDQGSARLWPHSFSQARALWLAEEEGLRGTQRETQRRLQKEERKLDATRRTLAASERSGSAGARMKHRHDSDERSMGADYRAQTAERAHSATARRVQRQVGAVREALEQLEVRDEAGQALFLRYEPCPKATVLHFQGPLRLPHGEVLRAEVSLQLRRDEHVWLLGPNGRGKSTLLRALLAAGSLPAEKTLVLPQELTQEETRVDSRRPGGPAEGRAGPGAAAGPRAGRGAGAPAALGAPFPG